MSRDLAIRVAGLGKQFRLGRVRNEYPTLREALARSAGRLLRRRREQLEDDTIWALRDVSFEVRQGELLGVIGANGAGKSTLLKILSRITEPTTGRAEVRGRLGSLLEVGTGFHLELTGRENTFLSGAILGMKREEIARRFDEIVAFAEVERFIDTPVKYYSSGMYLRLAFAVAAHLEPEILLVDEVLAVGDAAFQQKCLGKMDSVARAGRTILFVSHNMLAVQSLCERALWLKQGSVVADGPAANVIADYMGRFDRSVREREWPDPHRAPGNEHARMRSFKIVPGGQDDEITVRTPLVLEFEYWIEDADTPLIPSILLRNAEGVIVFNIGPPEKSGWLERSGSGVHVRDRCFVPGDLLNAGTHRLEFCLLRGNEAVYRHEDALVFDVRDTTDSREGWYGRWAGAVRPILEWETETLVAPHASKPADHA